MARKPGSREYRGDDKLCVKMAVLILKNRVSVWEAAKSVAAEAAQRPHGTSLERRTRRLYERFRDEDIYWIGVAEPLVPRPRSSISAALRSMQPMLSHERWVNWRTRRLYKN
jgi:hypothetical protein